LRERNVSLVSHQEPWLNGSDATSELLAAVAAWVATQESVRRSERIRAGLACRKAECKPIGGACSKRGKDEQPRRTDGYKQAWARRKADAHRQLICLSSSTRPGIRARDRITALFVPLFVTGRDEDVMRLSPFIRHHLNVHGKYSFVLPELLAGLRTPRHPDDDD
jgi:hypothetical protein